MPNFNPKINTNINIAVEPVKAVVYRQQSNTYRSRLLAADTAVDLRGESSIRASVPRNRRKRANRAGDDVREWSSGFIKSTKSVYSKLLPTSRVDY